MHKNKTKKKQFTVYVFHPSILSLLFFNPHNLSPHNQKTPACIHPTPNIFFLFIFHPLSTYNFLHFLSKSNTTIHPSISLIPLSTTQTQQLLRHLSRTPLPHKTLFLYHNLRTTNVFTLDTFSFPPLLKAVSKLSALTYGLEIHGLASKLGFLFDPFIQTALIAMYASCARIMDARLLFAKMSHPDAVAWNTIIDGYCQNGHFNDALSLFEDMKNSGVKPDFVILCTVLSACGHARNLSYGRSIHEFIKDNGLAIDSYLQSALINMYANCGAIEWESL